MLDGFYYFVGFGGVGVGFDIFELGEVGRESKESILVFIEVKFGRVFYRIFVMECVYILLVGIGYMVIFGCKESWEM